MDRKRGMGAGVTTHNLDEANQTLNNAKQPSYTLTIGVKQKPVATPIVLPCLLMHNVAWIICL
jgi:hypothetical protein